jgi:hypothetical protein
MWYNPVHIYKRWRNSVVMNKYLGKVLDKRFSQAGQQSSNTVQPGQKKQRKRAIIDLAFQAYQSQVQDGAGTSDAMPVMDAEFKKSAITQIRTFIFAG